MPQVSVIVPVYKVERYLSRCLDSIIFQHFRDYELLLVDDGSPDDSSKMCDEYLLKDVRIIAIHKNNGGVSSARNCGLDLMKGQHVTFIDSDDWITSDYIEKLAEHISYDLVCHSYLLLNDEDKILGTPVWPTHIVDNIDTTVKASLFTDGWLNLPSSKLASTKIINQHLLRFNEELSCGEDTLFNVQYLQYIKSVYTENISNYRYILYSNRKTLSNEDSISSLLSLANTNKLMCRMIYPTDDCAFIDIYCKRISSLFYGKIKCVMDKSDFCVIKKTIGVYKLSKIEEIVLCMEHDQFLDILPDILRKAVISKNFFVILISNMYILLSHIGNKVKSYFHKKRLDI